MSPYLVFGYPEEQFIKETLISLLISYHLPLVTSSLVACLLILMLVVSIKALNELYLICLIHSNYFLSSSHITPSLTSGGECILSSEAF